MLKHNTIEIHTSSGVIEVDKQGYPLGEVQPEYRHVERFLFPYQALQSGSCDVLGCWLYTKDRSLEPPDEDWATAED